ncbi:hypothetical protein DOTSEDRAFT_70415 [Dothistroma septosporum NZE10]|uniref:Uncharacterized protein n=1 Tax=Dothistroma septosporum (strain NZE10 / CBS 128990) TaxID=675120 RepID=N1PVG0_DOTSN|nr:hypothetical protein DOTSEDRAFT_70415 [Dothistroma septosporum NZE10]
MRAARAVSLAISTPHVLSAASGSRKFGYPHRSCKRCSLLPPQLGHSTFAMTEGSAPNQESAHLRDRQCHL